jgi:uncharacterized DUF497 family protein
MEIEFDPAKDAANIEKHGISLARAVELDVLALIEDDRFEEARFRIYGLIDGLPYCVAGTHRGAKVRIISLRRAHRKEIDRHA